MDYEFDELRIYRGTDIRITPDIVVKQPTIGQIADFGERNYFGAVYTLCAVGADLKWQLNDYLGLDYTKIEDYDLFIKLIAPMVSGKRRAYEEMMRHPERYAEEIEMMRGMDVEALLVNPLELVLNVDLGDFTVCTDQSNGQIIMYDVENGITIDRAVYARMVDAVRKIHGFKRNNEMPGNERTRLDLIEDARDEAMMNAKKPYKSILKPLISSLGVKCGMLGDDRVWNMPVNMFLDAIKRANRIQDSTLLLQGAYSGFASLKNVDKSRLDWMGDLQ